VPAAPFGRGAGPPPRSVFPVVPSAFFFFFFFFFFKLHLYFSLVARWFHETPFVESFMFLYLGLLSLFVFVLDSLVYGVGVCLAGKPLPLVSQGGCCVALQSFNINIFPLGDSDVFESRASKARPLS